MTHRKTATQVAIDAAPGRRPSPRLHRVCDFKRAHRGANRTAHTCCGQPLETNPGTLPLPGAELPGLLPACGTCEAAPD